MKEVKDPEEIKKLMKSQEPVAIFYYAAWCPHCKVMHEPFEQLEKEDKGKTKFVKMESEDIPDEFGISGYPRFVKVESGKVKKQVDGEMSKDELKSKLLDGGLRGGKRRLSRRRLTRRLRRGTRKSSH
jgi:thioredoxin-like negative regulator of GroEL